MPDRAWERIAFCPHPPLMIAGIGGLEAVAELAPVADAARAAARWVVEGRTSLAVVGAGRATHRYLSGHLATTRSFGPDLHVRLGSGPCGPLDPEMPLSLMVAATLLPSADLEVSAWSVGPDVTGAEIAEIAVAAAASGGGRLLVMGDGSFRRPTAESGSSPADPIGFDDRVANLLATGSAGALGSLDLQVANTVGAAGVRPWQLAAEVARTLRPQHTELDMYTAPFGVGYFVARWSS